jgi:3',5'-nucleoside bisphosphate phosphatase
VAADRRTDHYAADVRIDLHTHSNLSDGTDAPAALVARAAGEGLDVVALTDHDHALGWPEASAAADRAGISFVRGIELSTRHRGSSVHLLAYCPDPAYPPLAAAMERTRNGRVDRLGEWVTRGATHGITIDPEKVLAIAGDSTSISKNHIAELLVAQGVVGSREEAFESLLGNDGPLHVRRYAVTLPDAIQLVTDAGGVPVIAPPWARNGRDAVSPEELSHLAGIGLAGIEVDHQGHDAGQREELRELARSLDLVVTGSSDYHGVNKELHELGCNTTSEAELDRLLSRVSTSRAPG